MSMLTADSVGRLMAWTGRCKIRRQRCEVEVPRGCEVEQRNLRVPFCYLCYFPVDSPIQKEGNAT
eukprot:scaffold45755_cov33-Cyclotella_meneghiniana.AAC.1